MKRLRLRVLIGLCLCSLAPFAYAEPQYGRPHDIQVAVYTGIYLGRAEAEVMLVSQNRAALTLSYLRDMLDNSDNCLTNLVRDVRALESRVMRAPSKQAGWQEISEFQSYAMGRAQNECGCKTTSRAMLYDVWRIAYGSGKKCLTEEEVEVHRARGETVTPTGKSCTKN